MTPLLARPLLFVCEGLRLRLHLPNGITATSWPDDGDDEGFGVFLKLHIVVLKAVE